MELPSEWHAELKNYCDDREIEFMSTPFDEESVDKLYKLGLKDSKFLALNQQT